MTVDTAAMRLVVRTILHQEHCTSLEDDAQALLDSAADELDELRKQRTAGYLMHVERTLDDERAAHAETRRELATMTDLRDKAVAEGLRINEFCFRQLSETVDPLKHELRDTKRELEEERDGLRDTLIMERSLRVKSERELDEMRSDLTEANCLLDAANADRLELTRRLEKEREELQTPNTLLSVLDAERAAHAELRTRLDDAESALSLIRAVPYASPLRDIAKAHFARFGGDK